MLTYRCISCGAGLSAAEIWDGETVCTDCYDFASTQLGLDIGQVEQKLRVRRGPDLYQPGLFSESRL